ncbi:hypothetical protein KSP39_PZI007141 [Platanthera zijinensis]|uniref:Uncharacterized protein n=1 Tax=Platanthera zijinensis TaxID=2320716 RepID=A0AAP0BRS3_9ASPA
MSNLETRTLMDDLRSLNKGRLFDLGHPLLNRVAESFVKAAGIGALQAVSSELYFTVVEGSGFDSGTVPKLPGARKRRFPDLRGKIGGGALLIQVKNTGKESLQWGKFCSPG